MKSYEEMASSFFAHRDKYYGKGYEVNSGYFYVTQARWIVGSSNYHDEKNVAFTLLTAVI